nr:unnamed protein product [Callosobruchus chinensis]
MATSVPCERIFCKQGQLITERRSQITTHLTGLLHGQLHNRTQQAKEDLTTFAYEVQSLAKRAFRHIMNLLKKKEQHEATLKDFKEKHGKFSTI